ncbi:shikimate kinase, partial [uncultured Micrococcus sp.]
MTDAPSPVDLAPSWEAMVRGMDARLAAARARREGAAGEPAVGVGVVLVGPMGAGKTTVGRLVAERLSLAFIDADDLFVRAHGPIPAFFAEHGEPAFRREEERVVAHVLEQSEPCVLACGGGAVLSAATRRRLTASPALVVSLTVAE